MLKAFEAWTVLGVMPDAEDLDAVLKPIIKKLVDRPVEMSRIMIMLEIALKVGLTEEELVQDLQNMFYAAIDTASISDICRVLRISMQLGVLNSYYISNLGEIMYRRRKRATPGSFPTCCTSWARCTRTARFDCRFGTPSRNYSLRSCRRLPQRSAAMQWRP